MSRPLPLDEPPSSKLLARSASAPGWKLALSLLGAGLLALGLLFLEEAVAAIHVWESSEAYNHCWLVLPVAAYLGWIRRDRLHGLAPRPTPILALLAPPVGLAWLGAERLGIMEGRQLTALAMVHVLVLSVLGWRVARAMAAPLVYLVFLVPFGAFATPALQRITAWMVEIGLGLLGISHYVDDLIIETPAGTFLVAEACAGLRFLIAALAFGALYALVMFRSPGRRLAVMALALVVPIFANGLRALGIVVLGQYLGSAEAAVADHIVYGWVFFSLIILLLIVAGLPFRQDSEPVAAPNLPLLPPAAPRPAMLLGGAVLAVALAAAAPVLARTLEEAGSRAPERVALPLAPASECRPEPGGAALRCGELRATAEAIVFPPQATWRAVSAELLRVGGSHDQDIQFSVQASGSFWRARQGKDTGATVAVSGWLNGAAAGGGVRSRAEQALNSLGAGRGRPVLVTLILQPERPGRSLNPARERALAETILKAQGATLAARGAALSGTR